MAKIDFLSAPIPGMSLTTEPGNRPWEQPPQLTKLSEVVDYYTDRLTEPELVDSLMDAISNDAPVYETVMGLVNYSVMNGVHSVDTGMMVSVVVVEMIKALAELNGIGYILTANDKEKMTRVDSKIARDAIREVTQAANQPPPVKEEVPESVTSRGLMAKGAR
jgi:hypothetical protein